MTQATADLRVNDAAHAALSILCYLDGHEQPAGDGLRVCRDLCASVIHLYEKGKPKIVEALQKYDTPTLLATLRTSVKAADGEIPAPLCVHRQAGMEV